MTRWKRANAELFFIFALASGALGCLDERTETNPVLELAAPSSAIKLEPGSSADVTVQALDVNRVGVDGARVSFVRAEEKRIVFDGAEESADAVEVSTTTAIVDRLETSGVAKVRVRAPNDASAGATSVVAIVRSMTPPDHESVFVRVPIQILDRTDPGGDASPASGDSGESTEERDASGSADGGDAQ